MRKILSLGWLAFIRISTALIQPKENEQDKIGSKMPRLVLELMETYWLRPTPLNVASGKIGGKAVDIVQTSLEGNRIDFALDKKSHLPKQIRYYFHDPILKKTLVNIYNFSDYLAVDGIMMASTTRPEGESGKEFNSYHFNVEYDEQIFKTPPSFEAGPDAWKKK